MGPRGACLRPAPGRRDDGPLTGWDDGASDPGAGMTGRSSWPLKKGAKGGDGNRAENGDGRRDDGFVLKKGRMP
jgi:hypothetical protein